MERNVLEQGIYTGERALYQGQNLSIRGGVFKDGESPLKEAKNIDLHHSIFGWKYPLWYCENIETQSTSWLTMARAGVWYSNHVSVTDALIEAPKNFRRCADLHLKNVAFTDASETLWNCRDVSLENVSAKGTYFGMGCRNVTIKHCHIDGDYAFDGAENVTITDSTFLTKDAFWNCSKVTIENSTIIGEYFGWNSENITLKNCTIQSLQGFCYIQNVKLIDCRLIDTTLAFEYATVEAKIDSRIESVLNPASGTITAEEIGELIIEPDRVDPARTVINAQVKKTTRDAREVYDRNV